jgi:hypothetical protein
MCKCHLGQIDLLNCENVISQKSKVATFVEHWADDHPLKKQEACPSNLRDTRLARMFHESPTMTMDMGVPPGVLGTHTLRRTVQVRLGSETLRLPGSTPICTVPRRQFMKHAG